MALGIKTPCVELRSYQSKLGNLKDNGIRYRVCIHWHDKEVTSPEYPGYDKELIRGRAKLWALRTGFDLLETKRDGKAYV